MKHLDKAFFDDRDKENEQALGSAIKELAKKSGISDIGEIDDRTRLPLRIDPGERPVLGEVNESIRTLGEAIMACLPGVRPKHAEKQRKTLPIVLPQGKQALTKLKEQLQKGIQDDPIIEKSALTRDGGEKGEGIIEEKLHSKMLSDKSGTEALLIAAQNNPKWLDEIAYNQETINNSEVRKRFFAWFEALLQKKAPPFLGYTGEATAKLLEEVFHFADREKDIEDLAKMYLTKIFEAKRRSKKLDIEELQQKLFLRLQSLNFIFDGYTREVEDKTPHQRLVDEGLTEEQIKKIYYEVHKNLAKVDIKLGTKTNFCDARLYILRCLLNWQEWPVQITNDEKRREVREKLIKGVQELLVDDIRYKIIAEVGKKYVESKEERRLMLEKASGQMQERMMIKPHQMDRKTARFVKEVKGLEIDEIEVARNVFEKVIIL